MIIITLNKNSKYLISIKQIRSSFSVTFVIYRKRNQFLSSLLLSLSLSILSLSLLLYYYYYYYYYYHHHHQQQYEYYFIALLFTSRYLVKDTAILLARVVASSPKLRYRPVGDVNFKRFAITSNRSGKKLVINKICSFITLWSKSPNLSVFVLFTTGRSQKRLFYMNWCMSQYTFIGTLILRLILRVLY